MLVIFPAWEISHVQIKNVNELSDLILYNLVSCRKGTLMLIGFTFRRALLHQTPSSGKVRSRKLENRTEKLSLSVFSRIVCVKQEWLLDSVCPYLLRVILQGSPVDICDYEPSLIPFFQFRWEEKEGKRDQSSIPSVNQIRVPHVALRTQISPIIT